MSENLSDALIDTRNEAVVGWVALACEVGSTVLRTALDLAATRRADPQSLLAALDLAGHLVRGATS